MVGLVQKLSGRGCAVLLGAQATFVAMCGNTNHVANVPSDGDEVQPSDAWVLLQQTVVASIGSLKRPAIYHHDVNREAVEVCRLCLHKHACALYLLHASGHTTFSHTVARAAAVQC